MEVPGPRSAQTPIDKINHDEASEPGPLGDPARPDSGAPTAGRPRSQADALPAPHGRQTPPGRPSAAPAARNPARPEPACGRARRP
ncbi:hypothetical protein [Nonomuraea endophytica]|uniref:hypothetical protein n=1 Tax=Nonomuraea endophytica TaxID=714136 RepID=UPI0037C66B33